MNPNKKCPRCGEETTIGYMGDGPPKSVICCETVEEIIGAPPGGTWVERVTCWEYVMPNETVLAWLSKESYRALSTNQPR